MIVIGGRLEGRYSPSALIDSSGESRDSLHSPRSRAKAEGRSTAVSFGGNRIVVMPPMSLGAQQNLN
ncbi:hypothetical protein AALO_G00293700 [Alosa alosa]|uniref:Uncharacterized protein n=1 Tax=Alosa alosa TaxID=278164 RepID=A0AAV6FMB2_9TELE|nr:hypothetical protein AALO_G00293700 [Alosa alosa]